MPGDALRDFDFHPDEPDVRVFAVPRAGVLRADREALVYEVRYGDFVLRHYAFPGRWFRVNITTDLLGRPVETGPDNDQRFAFNCDIATPIVGDRDAVYGVDLFIDVLVKQDARRYSVCDLDAFHEAREAGLLSRPEANGAVQGLAELVDLIEQEQLMPYLVSVHPFGKPNAPPALRVQRVPLSQTPLVQPGLRPTWRAQGRPTGPFDIM